MQKNNFCEGLNIMWPFKYSSSTTDLKGLLSLCPILAYVYLGLV